MPQSSWWGEVGGRVAAAAVVALVVGALAAIVGGVVMTSTHYLCEWEVGGEAGSGAWLCPDGIAYFLPTAAISGSAAGIVMLAYVGFEVHRSNASEVRTLAHLACLLSAAVIGLFGVFLLLIGFPAWLAGGHLVVAVATWLLRRRPFAMLVADGIGIAVLGLVATRILLTAPAVAAAGSAWLVALLLHLIALHRERCLEAGSPSVHVRSRE